MSNGYDPEWDINLAYGHKGETEMLRMLKDATIEVKTCRTWPDLFVETGQHPKRQPQRKPSGLFTTKAKKWAFWNGDHTMHVMVPTGLLVMLANHPDTQYRMANRDGHNPTYGFWVTAMQLVEHGDPGFSELWQQLNN